MGAKITNLFQEPTCRFCHKTASQIREYVECAEDENMTPNELVKTDGTYNIKTNTFICTDCYIQYGCPIND